MITWGFTVSLDLWLAGMAAGPGAVGVDAAEARLNELAAPFSDDPAFQALLKLERASQRGVGGDATR